MAGYYRRRARRQQSPPARGPFDRARPARATGLCLSPRAIRRSAAKVGRRPQSPSIGWVIRANLLSAASRRAYPWGLPIAPPCSSSGSGRARGADGARQAGSLCEQLIRLPTAAVSRCPSGIAADHRFGPAEPSAYAQSPASHQLCDARRPPRALVRRGAGPAVSPAIESLDEMASGRGDLTAGRRRPADKW